MTGDVNGDGHTDLAIANSGDDTVSVLLGNGDGTFQPQVTYPVGSHPSAIVAGDFRGDGRTDLAVVNETYNFHTVSVLLGNGDGTFQPPEGYGAGVPGSPFPGITSIAVGDFNGGGHLDLAVTTVSSPASFGSNPTLGLSVLVGNGDGTFQPQVTYAVGSNPMAIAAGDFNGDGRLDLAVAGISGVSVLLGNGDGTFHTQTTYLVGSRLTAIAAGNFNGRLDLAVPNYDFNTVSVLLNNGDGSFSSAGQFATTPRATPLVADVNSDGANDVLVVDGDGNILYRQGIPGQPGTFEPPVTVNSPINGTNPYASRDIAWVPYTSAGPLLASIDARDNAVSLYAYRGGAFIRVGSLATGSLPAQIIAADLTGDGLTDLVVRNSGDGTLSVFLNNSTGTQGDSPPFLQPVTLPVGLGVSDAEAIDTTGNGTLDLVVTNKLSGQIGILRNLGNGSFAPLEPYRAGTELSAVDASSGTPEVTSLEATASVAAGPFTAGGAIDLVTANPGSNTLGLLAGLGLGRFANPVSLSTSSPAQVVRVADFNHDGIPDMAVLTASGLSIFLGNGKGGFAPPITYDAGPDPTGLTVADVNHDGNLDLLIGNSYGDVLLLVNQGDGTFQPYRKTDQAITLAVADLTGSGSKDVIFADQGLDRVVVDYGAGKSAVLGDQSTGLLSPGAVKLADLNGNGIPDLIVANSGSNNVLIYPGLGNGQFGPAVNGGHGYFVGTNPVGITVANLTGGLPDLVVADKGSNQVSILLNQSQDGSISFRLGPRLNSGGTGPFSTVVGRFTGSANQDILVSNSGSNNVALLPGVGQGFFNDTSPQIFPVGTNPGPLFVGNFDGTTDLLTLNAGSNDLTLISDFMSADRTTRTISSGGTEPDAGFTFSTNSGFDNLVVGNGGNGVLALFEGGAGGLTLTSSDINPNLPSPSALVFIPAAGSQVQFYAATEGREAAVLVALSLGSEFIPASGTAGSTQPFVAQLVALQESSLAIVGTLLVVTLPSTASELNLGSAETEAAASVPLSSAAAVSVGQGLAAQSHGDDTGSAGDEPNAEPEDANAKAAAQAPDAAPWKRFILGTDEALERFNRDHPELFPTRRNATPETKPADGHGALPAPNDESTPLGQGQSTSRRRRFDAIDQAIEVLDDRDLPAMDLYLGRMGESHQRSDHAEIKMIGFTVPAIERRLDLSAALALAATVAGEFYFRSVDHRTRSRPRFGRVSRWATSRGDCS